MCFYCICPAEHNDILQLHPHVLPCIYLTLNKYIIVVMEFVYKKLKEKSLLTVKQNCFIFLTKVVTHLRNLQSLSLILQPKTITRPDFSSYTREESVTLCLEQIQDAQPAFT